MGATPMEQVAHDLAIKANAIHWYTAWIHAFQALGDAESARELSAVLTEEVAHRDALQLGLNRMVEQGRAGRRAGHRREINPARPEQPPFAPERSPQTMATTDERTQTAADLMTPAPRTCTTYSTVLEAVMIFRDADCGAVPILQDGKPVGILTDRDVALALAEHPDLANLAVSDIMTNGVIAVPPNATLEVVRQQFAAHGVRRLLVVDNAGALQGIIAWADLAEKGSDHLVGRVASSVLEKP